MLGELRAAFLRHERVLLGSLVATIGQVDSKELKI